MIINNDIRKNLFKPSKMLSNLSKKQPGSLQVN